MTKRSDLKSIKELAKKIAILQKRKGALSPELKDLKNKVNELLISYEAHQQQEKDLQNLKEYIDILEAISRKHYLAPISKEELIREIRILGKKAGVAKHIIQSAINQVIVDDLKKLALSANEIPYDQKSNSDT
jgi:hypothetical protein